MSSDNTVDSKETALAFAKALGARDYPGAYGMTSQAYRKEVTVEQLRDAFEEIVPTDWGEMGPIEVGETMEDWPGKEATDIGWVYVSIGGDMYSEAISVIVAAENDSAKIREIEFGRP